MLLRDLLLVNTKVYTKKRMKEQKLENSVFLVGGGPSLSNFNFSLLQDRWTIVVNKAIVDVPNPDYFITTDFLFSRKNINIKPINTAKIFVAAMYFNFMEEQDGRIIDTKHQLIYDLSNFDMIIKSRKVDGFGYTFKDFRTGLNSGYCALQLAILLGYKTIYLLGYDMCMSDNNRTHYHRCYTTRIDKFSGLLEIYYQYFVSGLQQLKQETDIQVISLSDKSRLNNIIEYQDINKALK